MKLKIFLTGRDGFIGKNILEGLGTKYSFFAPSHKQFDLLDFLSVQEYFEKNGPFDVVLHTAIVGGNRITGDSKELAFGSMRMFFNLTSCDKFYKRFFYFGSGIEYGREKPIKSFSEDDFGKRVPQSNWGLYKYVCARFAENRDKFINLRLFGVFGKYEDWRIRFISNSICKNIFNLPITINQNVVMDYLYIDDFVRILDRFIKFNPRHNVYNVTSGTGIDLVSIAKKINMVCQEEVKIKIRKSGMANEYTGSNKRLLREFGGINFTKIDDAISQLYQWYKARKNKIKKENLLKDYF